MTKRGRPKLEPWDNRMVILSVRLRGHEIESLKELAKEDGISVSDFVRRSIGLDKKYEKEIHEERQNDRPEE